MMALPFITFGQTTTTPTSTTNVQEYKHEGIDFFKGSLAEAIAHATEENKPIFIDAYTDWCAPCKRMDKQVFTRKDVGDFYNAEFVSYRLNMESEDGVDFAPKHGVQFYPTFVYLDSKGEAVHKTVGECDPYQFLTNGECAIDEKRQLFTLEKKFKEKGGKCEPELLFNYAKAVANTGHYQHELMTEISDAYLGQQDDLTTPKNMDFIMLTANEQQSIGFRSLMEHKDKYLEIFGDNKIINKIRFVTQNEINLAASLKDEEMMLKVLKFNEDNISMFAGWINSRLKASYYEQTEEWEKYAPAAIDFIDTYGKRDLDLVNHAAWTFYENVEDEAHLKKALEWMEEAIRKSKSFFYYETYAALLFKTGQKEEALKIANEAIPMADSWGANPKLLEALITRIKQ